MVGTCPVPIRAQEVQGGLDFLVGFPQGEFKRNINKTGYGIVGNVGWAPEESPFMFGIEVGYMIYGSESRREPFSTTIPDVTVNVNTHNNLVPGHVIARVQPNVGTFRPYVQGMVGMNYLFTNTTIENRGGGEEVASDVNQSDVTFSYGGGGGIMVSVYTGGENESIQNVLIHLGARYVKGGNARYLKEGSIRREAGRVIYDTLESTTDLLTFLIGASVHF
jgi:hypothetical protein